MYGRPNDSKKAILGFREVPTTVYQYGGWVANLEIDGKAVHQTSPPRASLKEVMADAEAWLASHPTFKDYHL